MAIHFDMTTARMFVAVVEEGSIAGGARRESVVPSTVSKRLAELEQRLGLPLVHRRAGGVTVTSAGAAVLRRARNLLRETAELEAELQRLGSGVQGLIRVAAVETAMVGYLPARLAAFLSLHPGISVELDERLSAEVVRMVEQHEADFGIHPDHVAPPGLWTRPCHRDQIVAVVRRDHPLASYPGVTMSEMLDHEIIGADRRGALNALLERQAAVLGRALRIRVRADGYDLICRLVQEGLGVGIVAESSATLFVEKMELMALPLLDSWARRDHRICIRRPEAALPAAARLLLEHLLRS